MSMHIDESPVPRRKLCDDPVHPVKVGTGNSRVNVQKIARVVAEGGVVNRAEENRSHRQCAQECIELLFETTDAFAGPVGGNPGEEIITADCHQRGRRTVDEKALCLPWKAIDYGTIHCPMVQLRRAGRKQVATCEFREQRVIIAHDELPRVYAIFVVTGAVKD